MEQGSASCQVRPPSSRPASTETTVTVPRSWLEFPTIGVAPSDSAFMAVVSAPIADF